MREFIKSLWAMLWYAFNAQDMAANLCLLMSNWGQPLCSRAAEDDFSLFPPQCKMFEEISKHSQRVLHVLSCVQGSSSLCPRLQKWSSLWKCNDHAAYCVREALSSYSQNYPFYTPNKGKWSRWKMVLCITDTILRVSVAKVHTTDLYILIVRRANLWCMKLEI